MLDPALPPLTAVTAMAIALAPPYPLLQARAALAEKALSELVDEGGDLLGAAKLRVELLQLASRTRQNEKRTAACWQRVVRAIKGNGHRAQGDQRRRGGRLWAATSTL